MAGQIKFFEKNRIDLSETAASITVTDAVASNNGQDFINFVRNRNNVSAWITTGSTDAANTQLDVDFGGSRELSDIILIKHNWKSYTIQYWDGFVYTDFSTAINVSANTDDNTAHEFTQVSTSKIRIIITATFVVDDDKKLYQLICTDKLVTGQLEGWPEIKTPEHDTNKRVNKMLSGKASVVESYGAFSMTLSVKNWNIDADLDIIESIYFGRRGVLVWLCGGDETQFSHQRVGYRKEDIYFMRATNDYRPEWVSGIYKNGLKISMKLIEAIR